jgi:hypothetical protein
MKRGGLCRIRGIELQLGRKVDAASSCVIGGSAAGSCVYFPSAQRTLRAFLTLRKAQRYGICRSFHLGNLDLVSPKGRKQNSPAALALGRHQEVNRPERATD